MPTEAHLTCPHCHREAAGVMPDDACVFFFECPHCKELLRPHEGDCCVFCSYGDHACQPRLANIGGAQRRD